jgi:hypothetical protein
VNNPPSQRVSKRWLAGRVVCNSFLWQITTVSFCSLKNSYFAHRPTVDSDSVELRLVWYNSRTAKSVYRKICLLQNRGTAKSVERMKC